MHRFLSRSDESADLKRRAWVTGLGVGPLKRPLLYFVEAARHLNTATEQTKDLQIPLAAWKVNVSLGELYRATHRQDEAATCFGVAAQLLRHIAEQSPEPMQHSILTSEQFRALEK